MEIIEYLINALIKQDFKILSDPSFKWMIYSILFLIIFLENGFLPAAFLPGDTILVLVGILISKGVINFIFTIVLLIVASSLGYWFSYLQGKWLRHSDILKKWLSNLSSCYYKRANNLFYHYGLSALLIGRFISFVRTLLPTIAGLSEINNLRFQIFNWISASIWVLVLVILGYSIGNTKTFHIYEKQVIIFIISLPLVLLFISLIWLFYILCIKKLLIK